MDKSINKINDTDLKLLKIRDYNTVSDGISIDTVEVHVYDTNNNYIVSNYNLNPSKNNLPQWNIVEDIIMEPSINTPTGNVE
jgi:hypothetical protein